MEKDTYEMLTLLALFLGALWPIYQIYQQFRGANLRVRLTTEAFFRVSTAYGEALFAKPVLLAENGNILIEAVGGKLQRITTDSKKEWTIEFSRFGEIVRNPSEVFSNHHFHSSSPLQFLVENVPLRAVYMGTLKGYSGQFKILVSQLSQKTIGLQKTLPSHLTQIDSGAQFQGLSAEDQQKLNGTANDMLALSNEFSSKLVNQIQLEKGTYELTVTVEYRPLKGLLSRKKQVSSSIGFTVEDAARETISSSLPRALTTEMGNIIFGHRNTIINPEYLPKDAHEL